MTMWVAGVATVAGSVISANAADKAARTQADSAEAANQTALQEQQNAQQFLQPYQGAGQSVLPQLQAILSGDSTALNNLPGYQFALSQGQQAITNSSAGGSLGGNTLAALQNNAIGTANQYVGQDVNMLQNFANMGANAAGGQASGALQTGQTIGQNLIGAGNAMAAGQVGVANAITGGINSGLNAYQQNQILQGLNQTPLSQAPGTPITNTSVNASQIPQVGNTGMNDIPLIPMSSGG